MVGWDDACVWEGSGLRREVFFFRSQEHQLYGSLYAASPPAIGPGFVACASWGTEADRSDAMVRAIALAAARRGGAALVFHYPGYADSHGDLANVAVEDLVAAAVDAVGEARRRLPGVDWGLAGFVFGAGIALLAQRLAAVRRLLLVQPALRPGGYLRRLAANVARSPLKHGRAEGMAYGYPLPPRILDRAEEVDAWADAALAAFEGEATVLHQPGEPLQLGETLPASFERIAVDGTWRFGARAHPELTAAAVEWLDRLAREPSGTAA